MALLYSLVLKSTIYFLLYVITGSCVNINDAGGYEVVVAVSPIIPDNEVEGLLIKLKSIFKDTSNLLHLATRSKFYFSNIIFLLPHPMEFLQLEPEYMVNKHISNPDIVILDEGLFQHNPYTLQYAGCGEQALHIAMPKSFFTNINFTYKAKTLVHEWAHYKYGVFDEHGFPGDPLYPLYYIVPGQDDTPLHPVSGCTNTDGKYIFRNVSGFKCTPVTDNDCYPFANSEGNEEVISSLMHKPFLPQVHLFCDEDAYLHNRNAMTKQNAHCRERSVWDVISHSTDYNTVRSNTARPPTPKYKYIVTSNPQLVLVVEGTDNLANGSLDMVRNAFSYFLYYDLPKNSQVGIMNLKPSKIPPVFVTINSTLSIERLLDAFPEAYGSADVCVHCGIRSALKILQEDSTRKDGTVLLVTKTDVTDTEVENLISSLNNEASKLFVIYFGSTDSNVFLEKISVATGGKFWFIPDVSDAWTRPTLLSIIYEAFRHIYESFSWSYRNIVMVAEKKFEDAIEHNTMTFYIEEEIEELNIVITGINSVSRPIIKDRILLKHHESEYGVGHHSFSYKVKIPAYIFTIKNPEAGEWILSFQRKFGITKSLLVIVRATSKSSNGITNIQCWMSPYVRIPNQKPTAIYTSVNKGIRPVIKANITAYMKHVVSGSMISFELFDQGEGDPDITKDDGIYSRYFHGIATKGYYILTVVAKKRLVATEKEDSSEGIDDCCGSFIPSVASANINTFHRINIYGSFRIDNEQTGDFPPRRILDLHIVKTETVKYGVKYYTLQWTSPGKDYDYGTAAEYILRLFHTRDDALNNFHERYILTIDKWMTHGPLLVPHVAGTVQSTVIELRNLSSGLYFIAMTASDNSGNIGDVSNIVQIYFTKPSLPTLSPVPTQHSTASTTEIPEVTATGNAYDVNLGLVLGISFGVLFCLIVCGLIILMYCIKVRNAKNKLRRKMSISPPYFPRRGESPYPPKRSDYNERLYDSMTSVANDTEHDMPRAAWPQSNSSTTLYSNSLRRERRNRPYIPNAPDKDDISVASYASPIYTIGKYGLDNGTYNTPYFNHTSLRDNVNIPFNPMYTSSLRRLPDDETRSYLSTDV